MSGSEWQHPLVVVIVGSDIRSTVATARGVRTLCHFKQHFRCSCLVVRWQDWSKNSHQPLWPKGLFFFFFYGGSYCSKRKLLQIWWEVADFWRKFVKQSRIRGKFLISSGTFMISCNIFHGKHVTNNSVGFRCISIYASREFKVNFATRPGHFLGGLTAGCK